MTVKEGLTTLCAAAGRPDSVVRIACRELESWYLADLKAVAETFGDEAVLRRQEKARYRTPDAIRGPARELRRIVPGYQKISGSRDIGRRLDPDNTRSHSFFVFVSGVRRLALELDAQARSPRTQG